MNIYSIKNEKLGFFNRPIYCESEAEALSYIQNVLMSDADRALSNLKGDLALYHLGEIDFTTGIISPCVKDTVSEEFGYSLEFSPEFVCTLEEIFNTIPEDRLKPKLTEKDLQKAYDKIKDLENTVIDLSDKLKSHKHYRKEILK